jgi:hypothetical protein
MVTAAAPASDRDALAWRGDGTEIVQLDRNGHYLVDKAWRKTERLGG